jgi:hypothetical protein
VSGVDRQLCAFGAVVSTFVVQFGTCLCSRKQRPRATNTGCKREQYPAHQQIKAATVTDDQADPAKNPEDDASEPDDLTKFYVGRCM